MSRSSKIIILILLIVAGIGVVLFCSVKGKIAPEIKKELGLEVTVGDAYLLPFSPKMVMHDVHIAQPLGYGEGDALTIGKVTVTFDGYDRDPLVIDAVVAEDVHGTATFVDNTDNFFALQEIMDRTYKEKEEGLWSTKAVLQTIQVRNVSLTSGQTTTALADRNSQPIGAASDPVPLNRLVGLTIAKILENERQALLAAAVQDLKAKAKDAIGTAAEKIKQFLSEPEPEQKPQEKPAE